jgi:hypothetical protein
MKNRSSSHEIAPPTTPACWQREARPACLRIETAEGVMHLFPYQNFVTAVLTRGSAESDTLRMTFASHDIEIAGRNLRELLLALQEFAVKWMRPAAERYHELAGQGGTISAIRITQAE